MSEQRVWPGVGLACAAAAVVLYAVMSTPSPGASDLTHRPAYDPATAATTPEFDVSTTPVAAPPSQTPDVGFDVFAIVAARPRVLVWWIDAAGNATAVESGSTPFALPASPSFTFVVDPAAIGRPPPTNARWDLFRVDVMGRLPARGGGQGGRRAAVRASPRVAVVPGAPVYTFTLALPPVVGTSVVATVRLQQRDFAVAVLGSRACAPPDAAKVVATAALGVVAAVSARAASEGDDDRDEDAPETPPLPPCGRGADAAAALATGWYVAATPTPRAGPAPALAPPRPFDWTPARCRLLAFGPEAARACLTGVWLAFVGDSTAEELAIATALLLHGTFDDAWTQARCHGAPSARMFDTGHALPGGARVTMHWAGARDPCDNHEGASVFEDAGFRARFAAAHAHDELPDGDGGDAGGGGGGSGGVGSGGGGGARAPTFVANSGLHDLQRQPTLTLAAYAAALSATVLPLLSELGAPNRVVWKSSNPKTGEDACRRAAWHRASAAAANVTADAAVATGEAAVQALNAAAERAIALQPAETRQRFVVLDEHALLLPLPEPTQLFRHHCSALLDAAGRPGRRSMDSVHSGCLATVHALLNLLCPGGQGHPDGEAL